MALFDSERAQEFFLIVGDSFRGPNRKWIYFQIFILIVAFPLYFGIKIAVYNVAMGAYSPPKVNQLAEREPLEITDQGFLRIDENTYSPFVKIKNINLDWGVAKLSYNADIKSSDGNLLATSTGMTFILPAGEKYIVLPRFTTAGSPASIDFSVLESKFVLKPTNFPDVSVDVQRTQITFSGDQTVLSAVLKNNSPFTITQVDLPVLIYNEQSKVVAINYTNINDLKSGELRSFQMTWPVRLPGNLRAEITPELNIFNKEILKTQGAISPFIQ